MSARQTAIGSRVTSAAARSQLSSAPRNHSSSASWMRQQRQPGEQRQPHARGAEPQQDEHRGLVEHVVGVHVGGLVGQHGPAAVVVEDPHELGVEDHHRPLDCRSSRRWRTALRHVEVGHGLEVEGVEALAVQDPDVRQLLLAQAHRRSPARRRAARARSPGRRACAPPRRGRGPCAARRWRRGRRGADRPAARCPRASTRRREVPCEAGYPRATPRLDCASMRAATIRDGQVVVAEHPDPQPGSGEVLVRVHAAGLNGADIHQRAGHYPAPPGSPPDIPGLELAGEVVARGPGAERFAEGDRVMAVVGGRRPGRAGHGARAPADAGTRGR